ncbi:hypothetical protein TIFTF001_023629 [Ficus carica]|uniref:Uncharacterized protein n=1 Tax=Ficus carica TaxID=3494 RepID=A0AA88DGC6_FICCA|nr:hypothetical protein TIFTF001_023629 [Ficus carica]
MAMASRAIIKKTFPQLYASSSSVLSSTACFSTAHEFAEGSNNIDNAVKEGLQEAKHQGLSMPEDVARDGAVKAAEKADAVGETAEETLEKIKDKAA